MHLHQPEYQVQYAKELGMHFQQWRSFVTETKTCTLSLAGIFELGLDVLHPSWWCFAKVFRLRTAQWSLMVVLHRPGYGDSSGQVIALRQLLSAKEIYIPTEKHLATDILVMDGSTCCKVMNSFDHKGVKVFSYWEFLALSGTFTWC